MARQTAFNRVIKWAFNPEDRGPDPLRILAFVNPLIMFPLVVLLGGIGRGFWSHYLYSLLVGEGVSLTCFATTALTAIVGAKLLKVEVRRRTFILASAAAMFPGLWVGFTLADKATPLLGLPPSTHTLVDYSAGMTIGSLIFGVICLLDLWAMAREQARRLENETLQAKLSALSAQMNPHLLFNALNTIASTIPTDPRAAEETTLRLSELYRGILGSTQRASHSLANELEICQAYLGVESARFGDRLRWSIVVEPGLEQTAIPALLIQPLVENAVKHGISQRGSGGSISIRVGRADQCITIVVDDDGIGLGNSRSTKGTGTGLSSCRSRLELLYQGRASFEMAQRTDGPGTRVQIRIPDRAEVPA